MTEYLRPLVLIKCIARKLSRFKVFCANFLIFTIVCLILLQLISDDEYQDDDFNDYSNETLKRRRGYDDNQTCKFPILNPYDPSILRYVKHPYQIYCQMVQPEFTFADGNYLYVDVRLAEKRGLENLQYKFLYRESENVVISSNWTEWTNFSDALLLSDPVVIKGDYGNSEYKKEYNNIHSSVFINESRLNELEEKFPATIKTQDNQDFVNVFIFGLDSISRSNFVRNLPKTYAVLTERMESQEFFGFSKVDDNTFPNLLAMFTGRKVTIRSSELENFGHFQNDYVDSYPFVWKNYSDQGYVTGLVEEQPGFMSYKAKGFQYPPTDVYLRPYGLVLNKTPLREYSSPSCVGNKAEARHYLDTLERFLKTHKNRPYFLFSFLWKLSHDSTSDIEMLDPMISRFFRSIVDGNLLDNTILMVTSDHGNRFDSIRKTLIGRYEERMPYLSVYIPKWFREKYPRVITNLRHNSWRLTCHFDVYETLVDVLYRKFDGSNERMTFRNRGKSLFGEISASRTCADADIPYHFCVCQEEENVDVQEKNDYVLEAASFVVKTINNLTLSTKKLCRTLKLSKILSAQKYKANDDVLQGVRWHFNETRQEKNVTGVVSYLRVTLTTSPNEGVYEALVEYFSDRRPYEFRLNGGDISRIDSYGKQGDCISMINRNLEKFCSCKR